MVIAQHGDHPPVPTYRYPERSGNSTTVGKRFSSAGRSRRRSGRVWPFRTSTLLRIAVGDHSHTLFAQRGSACGSRIPVDWRKVNPPAKALPRSLDGNIPVSLCVTMNGMTSPRIVSLLSEVVSTSVNNSRCQQERTA